MWSKVTNNDTRPTKSTVFLFSVFTVNFEQVAEAVHHKCSYKMVLCKYAANLQENTQAEDRFALQLYWNHTSAWDSPENLLHIFRIPFPKNTSEALLPK